MRIFTWQLHQIKEENKKRENEKSHVTNGIDRPM